MLRAVTRRTVYGIVDRCTLSSRSFHASKTVSRLSRRNEGLLERLVKADRAYEARVARRAVSDCTARREAKQAVSDDTDAVQQAKRTLQWLETHARQKRKETRPYDQRLHSEPLETIVESLVKRHVDDHEPLAYILGNQPFGPLTIKCEPPILIPRPETEFMAEHVAELLAHDIAAKRRNSGRYNNSRAPKGEQLRILDLCTGTGCIALLLRHRLAEALETAQEPAVHASITAADVSEDAIALTRENAVINDPRASRRAKANLRFDIRLVDMLDDASVDSLVGSLTPLPCGSNLAIAAAAQARGLFDCVVCNPPYLSGAEWQTLDASVRDWEDHRALVGDATDATDDGLLYYRRLADLIMENRLIAPPELGASVGDFDAETIAADTPRYRSTPSLAVEVGMDQASSVAVLFRQAAPASARITVWRDPFGKDRGVFLWLAAV